MNLRTEYLGLFVGMMIVTYIPRVLPYYLFEKLTMPTWIEKPLKILPCVAIGVFLFPGGVCLYPDTPFVAPLGLAASVAVTWISDNIPLGVFSAVASVFLFG